MPTLGIKSQIFLSNENARTKIHEFYKGLEVGSYTLKTLTLANGVSGTLNLSQSEMLMIVGIDESLTVSLTTDEAETIEMLAVGMLMLNASNLSSVTITNTSSSQDIILMF